MRKTDKSGSEKLHIKGKWIKKYIQDRDATFEKYNNFNFKIELELTINRGEGFYFHLQMSL